MATQQTLLELADSLEAAEQGSRELDAEIFKAFGAPLPKEFAGYSLDLKPDHNSASSFVMPVGEMQVRYQCPRYTTSIDAAMTLKPEGWCWMAGERDQGRGRAYVNNGKGSSCNAGSLWFEVVAATPALALAAAALRAKEG